MTDEQVRDGVRWTPSRVLRRLGLEINNPDSVCYWCAVNNIPIYCPAITDGSIGDMMFFHSYKRPEFAVDLIQDIRAINDEALWAQCTGKAGCMSNLKCYPSINRP
jgi:deoxyhypusine synthase